jgi:iron complex outermembrane receptor protein
MTRRADNNMNGVVTSFPLGDTGGVNPQVGIFFATPGSGRLRGTVSRKTRLPAIKDRYSYRMGRAIPNPDLNAERATTIEGGYDGPAGAYGSVSLAVFYTAVDDMIESVVLQPNLSQLQNVGDVRNSGFEAEWRLRAANAFQGSIGYSYLHRERVSRTTAPLKDTPAHKAFGYIAYSGIPRVRLIGSLNGESSRPSQDDAGVLLTLPGYSTVSAKAAFAVRNGLDLEVSSTNLFDRNYELYSGFPEPGRVGLVQLRYRF